ncbi:hypothetical protein [Pseudaestuariivita rosea]|uniref:hypothetical protein n=1 Tax=Pseudaestuariivita rosea TaxID=2763263 RepID=UPI001ABA472C|nr:hypothetical protein [Pseudaestuariivita rosea]
MRNEQFRHSFGVFCLIAMALSYVPSNAVAEDVAADGLYTFPERHDPPTAIDEDVDACALFETEQEFVVFNLVLNMEDKRIQMRVPKVYLEDRWDWVHETEHTAQLFRVDIRDFTPVTRPETSHRNKQGNWNWITFVINDLVSLDEIARLQVEAAVGNGLEVLMPENFGKLIRLGRPQDTKRVELVDYDLIDGPHRLKQIDHPNTFNNKNTFVDLDSNGAILNAFSCTMNGRALNPMCSQTFEFKTMTVQLDYRLSELPNWHAHKARVEEFLTCAVLEIEET